MRLVSPESSPSPPPDTGAEDPGLYKASDSMISFIALMQPCTSLNVFISSYPSGGLMIVGAKQTARLDGVILLVSE